MISILKVEERFQKISTLYLATILFLATCILYGNTLTNSLFYDDEQFIYKNEYVKTFNVPKFFSENLIAGSGEISNYYRPVLLITYGLEHAVFGFTPFVYHLTSFLLHALCSILIFLLLKKLFHNTLLSFLASVLFTIHPIQTEAVSYAAGRGDSLGMVFLLLTLLFSLSSQTKIRIASFAFLILALLSKELTLVTPGLIFITHIVRFHTISKKTLLASLTITLPYLVIALVYFFLRLSVLNFQNTLNFYSGTNIYTESILIRLNTFINLLPSYVSLLLYPNVLFIERPALVFPYLTPQTVAVLFVSLGTFAAGIKYFKKSAVILFSVAWFFISFIPTSGIIPINGIFYEHFVYFPSVGFFLLFSFIFLSLVKKIPRIAGYVLVACFIMYLGYLSVRTVIRNTDWHDPITFYTQTLKHSQTPRLYNNLAMAYAENGNYKEAITVYEKAIKNGDFYPQTRYNLGNVYLAIDDLTKAEEHYKKSLSLDKTFYLSYVKLFDIYKSTQNVSGIEWVIGEVKNLARENKNFEPLYIQLQNNK